MDDSEILFVLGDARSGTTYVNGIMDKWFGYGMGPEGAFVADVYERRARYGDLGDQSNLDRLLTDLAHCRMLEIMRSKWSEDVRVDVTVDDIRAQLRERSIAGAVYAVFAAVATAQNRPRVGNKWPDYWRILPALHEMFGERARYLFVLRDGRDVALSTMKMQWGQKSAWACATTWANCLAAVEKFARDVAGDRLMIVRYEDILGDPRASFQRLRDFVADPEDAGKTNRFVAEVEDNPMRDNCSKWRTQMSARDQRIYEAIAGEPLARHGYDLAIDAPRVSLAERGYYAGAEFLRRVRVTLQARLS